MNSSSSSSPIKCAESPQLMEQSPPKLPMKDASVDNDNNDSHSSSHSDSGGLPLGIHKNLLSTTTSSAGHSDDDEHDGEALASPSSQGHHQEEDDDDKNDNASFTFLRDNDEEDYLDQMLDEHYPNIHDELQRELDEHIDQALQEQLDQQMDEYFQKNIQDEEDAYYERKEQELLRCHYDSEEEAYDDFWGLYSKGWALYSKDDDDDDDDSSASSEDCSESDEEDKYKRQKISDIGDETNRDHENSTDQLLERLRSLRLKQATTTTEASNPCPSSLQKSTTPVVTVQQINAEIQQVIDNYKNSGQVAAKEEAVDNHIGDMTTSIDEQQPACKKRR